MADLRQVLVVGDGPVKDGPGLHGKDIGYIYASGAVELTVDYSLLNDAWVPITNPNPWRTSGKQGWVKWSRLVEIGDGGEKQYLVTIATDGTPSIKRIL